MYQFSRIEFRWDFIPGRDQISVRLTLGLRKLPQASRSLQRARIREHACLPRLRQTPPEEADRVLITPRPSRGVFSCGALGVRPLALHATWKPTFNISCISNITFHVARFRRDSLYASNIRYNGLHLLSGSYGHADRPDPA